MTITITFEPGLKPIIKHQQHDQKTHGSWASGVGNYDDVLSQTEPIMDQWREKRRELDKYLESKGLTRGWRDIQSDPKAKKLADQEDALWEKQATIYRKFYEEHFEPQPETEEFQRLRDKYVVADTPTLKMNRQLREGGGLTQRVKDADKLCAAGEVKKEVGVYRGAVLPKEMVDGLKQGTSFTDKGFQSTDISRGSAEFYAGLRLENGASGQLTLFRMTLKPGLNAVDVGYGEIVLQRNATMKVTGKSKSGKYTIVDVEVTK